MLQTRSLIETVTSAFLIATLSHAALLPASLNVSIQSENMRHILKWSPLKESCFSVNYTVRYQGEFEYMQNARWQDEPSCANIVRTECDLTVALSSDSDYNISVLARCDDSTLWTQLPKSFNRRDSEASPYLR
ncbi:cytokine receptor family member B16 [Tachysurus ichikawai]